VVVTGITLVALEERVAAALAVDEVRVVLEQQILAAVVVAGILAALAALALSFFQCPLLVILGPQPVRPR
jgi:hypothetical protein